MQKKLAIVLSLALLLAPALPTLALEAEPKAEAAKEEAKPASEAPELPEATEGEPGDAPEGVTTTAEPEVPKEELAVPGKVEVDEPESPFKWKNFGLGFLGGAVIGGAAGVLFLSRGDKGFDEEKAKVMGPAMAGGVGLVFGLAALLLGSTTPEEAKPPKVEEGALGLPSAPLAELSVRYDWAF